MAFNSYLDMIIASLGGDPYSDSSSHNLGRWQPPILGPNSRINPAPPIQPPTYGMGDYTPPVYYPNQGQPNFFTRNPVYQGSSFNPAPLEYYQGQIPYSQGKAIDPYMSPGQISSPEPTSVIGGEDFTPTVPPTTSLPPEKLIGPVEPEYNEPAAPSQPVGGFWAWSGGEYDPFMEDNSPGQAMWVPEGTQLGKNTGLYRYDPEQQMAKVGEYWQPIDGGIISPSGYYTKQDDNYVANWGEGNYCWDVNKGYHVRC